MRLTLRRTNRIGPSIALAMLGAASVVGIWAGPAAADVTCSDGGPCIVVRVVGANDSLVATQEFSVAQITDLQDLTGNPIPYQVRLPGGEVMDDPQPQAALSIQHLLTSVTTGPGQTLAWQSVTFTETPDRNGTPRTLQNSQLGDAGQNGFENGLMPAVFVVGGNDAIGYIRPLINDQDFNYADNLQTLSHGALVITAHTAGSLLTAQVTPQSTTVTAGQADAFTATVTGSAAQLSYAWSFGDGTTSTDAAPSHQWTTTGSYFVSVTVRDTDGSYGQSQPVAITVGEPPTAPTSGPTGGTGTHHHPHHPHHGPHHGHGHHQGGQPTHPPTQQPTAGPTSSPTPQATAGPSAVPTSAPTSAPSRSASAPVQPPKSPGGGAAVSGRLLADAAVYVLPRRSAPLTAPAADSGRTDSDLAWAWAGVGIVPLLLGLGMAGESVRLRRVIARMRA